MSVRRRADELVWKNDNAGNVPLPSPMPAMWYLLGGGGTVSAGDVGAFDEPLRPALLSTGPTLKMDSDKMTVTMKMPMMTMMMKLLSLQWRHYWLVASDTNQSVRESCDQKKTPIFLCDVVEYFAGATQSVFFRFLPLCSPLLL